MLTWRDLEWSGKFPKAPQLVTSSFILLDLDLNLKVRGVKLELKFLLITCSAT